MQESKQNFGRGDVAAYLHKVAAFRAAVNRGGWAPDKKVFIRSSGESYAYLSIARIKQLTAPLLSEAGLDMTLTFSKPVFEETGRGKLAVMELYVTMVDTDTGYGESDVVYGAARADDEKCISKAQTYALKSWLSCRFLLPEVSDAEEVRVSGAEYVPKSEEEKVTARSKVLAQSALPSADGASDPGVLPEAVRSLPVDEAQRFAIAKIDRQWRSGEHDAAESEEYERALASISGSEGAREFIKRYMTRRRPWTRRRRARDSCAGTGRSPSPTTSTS